YTGVFNIKPHQCMCLSFALLKSSDNDLSLLCEFYRVPNEIEKDLAQPSRITAQSCGHVSLYRAGYFNSFGVQAPTHHPKSSFNRLNENNGQHFKWVLARLYFGKIQNV